jgi:hypothetical protein
VSLTGSIQEWGSSPQFCRIRSHRSAGTPSESRNHAHGKTTYRAWLTQALSGPTLLLASVPIRVPHVAGGVVCR